MNPYKKTRLAFILIAELSVIALITAIGLGTTLSTNARIDATADEMITVIYGNPKGFDPKRDESGNPQPGQESGQQGGKDQSDYSPESDPGAGPGPDQSEEFTPPWDGGGFFPGEWQPGAYDILAGLRYFTVTFKADDTMDANLQFIAAFTYDEAIKMAEEIKESGSTKGYIGDYRYGVFEKGTDTEIIVLDWTTQRDPGHTFVRIALIVAGAGAGLSLVILILVSGFVTRPLEIADKKQKKFISDASHEMKTPLAIISTNTEIIEMIHGEDETTDAIKKQVGKMTEMIRSFSSFVKIGQTSKNEFSSLNLTDIAYDLTSDFRSTLEKKGIKFEVSIQERITMKGHENQIRTLFSTLLDNARKYAKSFCLFALYKSGRTIIVRVKNDADQPLVPGPKPEVFDRFYRTDEARGSGIEGSGIGLSIAQEIVKLHDGKITCNVTKEKEFVIQIEF